MLKRETVEEFRKILKEDYGQNLSMQEVTEVANSLVDYFGLLAKIYHQNMVGESHKARTSHLNIP